MRTALLAVAASLTLAAPAAAAPIQFLGDPFPLTGIGAETPHVAFNPETGTYLHAYRQDGVWVRVVSADGAAGAPVEVSAAGFPADVAYDRETGGWFVIWEESTSAEPSGNEVFGALVSPQGAPGDGEQLTFFADFKDAGDAAYFAKLARGSDKACPWLIAFEGYEQVPAASDVYTVRADAAGAPCAGDPVQHTTLPDGDYAYPEALGFLPGLDRFVLSSVRDEDTDTILLELLTPTAGDAAGAGASITVADVDGLDMHMTPDGGLLAYEVPLSGDQTRLYARGFTVAEDGTITLGSRHTLSPEDSDEDDRSHRPTVAYNATADEALVAWLQAGDDIPGADLLDTADVDEHLAVRLERDGSPIGDAFFLAPAPAGDSDAEDEPGLAAGAGHVWLTAYNLGSDDGDEIFGRLYGEDFDLDDDGVTPPADCDDADPAIPGTDVPANGIDEDCSGADATTTPPPPPPPPPPPGGGVQTVTGAKLSYRFSKRGRSTRVRRLRVRGAAGPITIECVKRKRCPKRLRKAVSITPTAATVNLRPYLRGRLKPKLRITITLAETGRLPRAYEIRTRAKGKPRVARS